MRSCEPFAQLLLRKLRTRFGLSRSLEIFELEEFHPSSQNRKEWLLFGNFVKEIIVLAIHTNARRLVHTRYNEYLIAEPEKALLDWIYLNRQEGLPTALDELHLQFLTPTKLRDYALRFPRTVGETIKDLLVEAAFPSQNPDDRRPRSVR